MSLFRGRLFRGFTDEELRLFEGCSYGVDSVCDNFNHRAYVARNRAMSLACQPGYIQAEMDKAWDALRQGDKDEALRLAQEALAFAREKRSHPSFR